MKLKSFAPGDPARKWQDRDSLIDVPHYTAPIKDPNGNQRNNGFKEQVEKHL